MNSFYSILAFGASILFSGQPDDLKPIPGQVQIPEDQVYSTVAKLRPGQTNWIGKSDVIVDGSTGVVWIKSTAKARSQKMAQYFGKEPVLQITCTDKGCGIICPPGDWEWEPTDRKDITFSVVPCMSWQRSDDGLSKTKKGGAKTKGGDQ